MLYCSSCGLWCQGIPVTRVSNGNDGLSDLISKDINKDSTAISDHLHCTDAVFLGLINTCGNRNGYYAHIGNRIHKIKWSDCETWARMCEWPLNIADLNGLWTRERKSILRADTYGALSYCTMSTAHTHTCAHTHYWYMHITLDYNVHCTYTWLVYAHYTSLPTRLCDLYIAHTLFLWETSSIYIVYLHLMYKHTKYVVH